MGDCARNRKRREENAEAMESSTVSFSKKMKIQFDFTFEEQNLPSLSPQLLQDHPHFSALLTSDKTLSPASSSSNSSGFLAGHLCSGYSCFSNESSSLVKDSLRFVDLESFETESSTCIDNKFREATPSSEFYGDTDGMDSKAVGKKLPAKKMPNQQEINEFFSEAEKKEQKRFADKYNYDIVKDVPLQGRYEWVRLKP